MAIGVEGGTARVGLKGGTRFTEQGWMATPRTLRSRATLTAAAVFAASVALRVVEPWANTTVIQETVQARTGTSGAAPLPGAPACPTFPADSFWHADVSALPVHAQSSA